MPNVAGAYCYKYTPYVVLPKNISDGFHPADGVGTYGVPLPLWLRLVAWLRHRRRLRD